MAKITPDEIVNRLVDNSFEAYLVGGCVRDKLLGQDPNDLDITTQATPDAIALIFAECPLDEVGKKFGVMLVNMIEVATFRSETYRVVGKPDVELVGTFYEDSSRRDFTVNAMAEDRDGNIIDYHGGREDLKNKLIRAVGNPVDRFKEDPSRILRGMYLAARLKFDIEATTQTAMREEAELLKSVPLELVGKIVEKVIKYNCLRGFMEWLRDTETLNHVFPELTHTLGVQQNPRYHNSDVFEHTLRVVEAAQMNHPGDVTMALAGVFHDCPKGTEGIRGVNREGQPNDLGHEEAGAPVAEKAVIRLNFRSSIAKQVSFLVNFHGVRLAENPDQHAVKRMIFKMKDAYQDKAALHAGLKQLFAFMDCDAEGFDPAFGTEIKGVNATVWNKVELVIGNTIFYRGELTINGNDLIAWGMQGKQIGEVLDYLVSENIQDRESIVHRLKKKGYIKNSN